MITPRLLLLSLALSGAAVAAETALAPVRAVAEQYCVDCHDADVKKGGLNLAAVLTQEPAEHPEVWEKVVRRLSARQMPPASKNSRPTEDEYASTIKSVAVKLDAAAATHPNPGRTETIRRLNRTEYQNAVRDLLAVEIDAIIQVK